LIGEKITRVVTLDSYVAEQKLPHVDFIKLDTEGAELEILRGATNSIAKWKPKLAISAYHKVDDLWVLSKFVKSIRPDYEFALRHWPTADEGDGLSIAKDIEELFITKDMQATFAKFNLDTRRPTFCDCVLMCR